MTKRWTIATLYPSYPEDGSKRARDTVQAYKAVAFNRDLLMVRQRDVAASGPPDRGAADLPQTDFITAHKRGVRWLMAIACDPSRHRPDNQVLADVWQTRQGLMYLATFPEPRPPGSPDRPGYSHSDPLAVLVVRLLLPPEPGEHLLAKCTHGGLLQFDPTAVWDRLLLAQGRLKQPRHVEHVAVTEVGPSAVP